ncbi:uncharacterized protein [Channa argus]|uniref:uncharacterized protein n=1 Tax=Channa argus TaxID=215402 RepID=UPI00352111C5
MQDIKAAVREIFDEVSEKAGAYSTVVGMFAYNFLYNKSFQCSSPAPPWVCWTYMFLPVLLTLVLMLWVDKSFQRTWKFALTRGQCNCGWSCHFWRFLCAHILKSLFMALLWTVSVLIDGDWYVCCASCCNGTLANEEHKSDLQNESRIQGLIILTIIISLSAFGSSLPWRRCSSWTVDVVQIILEEGENLGTDNLRAAAKTKLTEDLNRQVTAGQWGKCFDVADELIKKVTSVSHSEDGLHLDDFALSSDNKPQ